MSTPFIGQICFFPWNWAPQGWFLCDGSLQSVRQFPALYSLMGTTYGGDGRDTFGLPNLSGRVPVGLGTAPGGSVAWVPGGAYGVDTVTLNSTSYLPNHTHNLSFVAAPSNTGTAVAGAMLGNISPNQFWAATPAEANGTFSPAVMGPAYSTAPTSHENRQPYLVLNACIAWDGEYPEFP
ncbi:phage tail protein [Radicibacter daui]|uniref:phage tail protein n=1 Tax=Radicibacter daui TaxID=3064829 RepID=UPI004046D1CD